MGGNENLPPLLRGRYEAREELGRGSQGRVLRAFDHQHHRDVALKIRPAGTDVDRDFLLGEARTLLSLRPHPGIPSVREDFFDGGDYVLVMDWVEGQSLARVLAERGDPGLAPSVAVGYLVQLAQALDHLHAHRPPVVHGDVKPANAILAPEGRVVLVDFGLVATNVASGTAGYVCPEVAAGEAPTPATDVWGLAATAVALLTGSPPAGGRPSWEGLDPSLVGALERGIRRGLALDPARRPGSAGELVERLVAALSAGLPTGVVTFCLTDIEEAMTLWDAHPEAMGEVVARSEAIVAEAVESAGGRLVKARGEGESTVSAFWRATDAAWAAVSVQTVLAQQSWPGGMQPRLRVALHTGEATLRGDVYSGPTLNRGLRLRELARGGQILCSRATAELIRDELPYGATLTDLGERCLRSLSRPEFVSAIQPPALFPAAKSQARERPASAGRAWAIAPPAMGTR